MKDQTVRAKALGLQKFTKEDIKYKGKVVSKYSEIKQVKGN